MIREKKRGENLNYAFPYFEMSVSTTLALH